MKLVTAAYSPSVSPPELMDEWDEHRLSKFRVQHRRKLAHHSLTQTVSTSPDIKEVTEEILTKHKLNLKKYHQTVDHSPIDMWHERSYVSSPKLS